MAVTPVLVAPGQDAVFPLPPAFVTPPDGHRKQACALAARARWLTPWAPRIAPWGVTCLGDDRYCPPPFRQHVLAQGGHVLVVCLPQAHPTRYEWLADCERNATVPTRVATRWTGTQRLTETDGYGHHPPVRASDDALYVDGCELTTTAATTTGRVLLRNAWATAPTVTAETVVASATAGRGRWTIANENNHTPKTQGDHFEHNDGHGEQHLSAVLATLILLAFLLHTVLDRLDRRYRAVRAQLPSRHTFFEHLRALVPYLPFETWDALFDFMLAALVATPPKTKIRPKTG